MGRFNFKPISEEKIVQMSKNDIDLSSQVTNLPNQYRAKSTPLELADLSTAVKNAFNGTGTIPPTSSVTEDKVSDTLKSKLLNKINFLTSINLTTLSSRVSVINTAYKRATISGSVASVTTSGSSAMNYQVISCVAGETFILNGYAQNVAGYYMVIFTDNSDNVISSNVGTSVTTWTKVSNLQVIAPTGATKLYFSSLNEVTAYFVDSKYVPYADALEGKFPLPSTATVTAGTYVVDNYIKKNNKYSVKWSLPSATTGSITFDNVNVVCKSTDRVGLWILCEKNFADSNLSTAGYYTLTLNGVSSGNFAAQLSIHPGWNYISFIPGVTSINSLTFSVTQSTDAYNFWFDSVEINYKLFKKPVIMLNFDCCNESMYNVNYPLLKSYGFKATFSMSYMMLPDIRNFGYMMSRAHFNELVSNGWDYGVYPYNSAYTMPDFSTSYSIDAVNTWTTYLKTYIDDLENIGIMRPFVLLSKANRSDRVLLEAQKKVGFKINRRGFSDKPIIDYYDKDVFETATVGLTDSNINIVKGYIDSLITTGGALSIFSHEIETGTTLIDSNNTLQSSWVIVLDYIKAYENAGAVEVITYRELYKRCEPNDYETFMTIRKEKQYQYLLSKVTQ